MLGNGIIPEMSIFFTYLMTARRKEACGRGGHNVHILSSSASLLPERSGCNRVMPLSCEYHYHLQRGKGEII